MTVLRYLQEHKGHFRITSHRPAYTAEQLARLEHVNRQHVAKCVVVKADDYYYLCVLPADRKVDLNALQRPLKAATVSLAGESEMARLFEDSEIGAEAPFGGLYDLPTLMDASLRKAEEIVFPADSHETSIHMLMDEYLRLACPRILYFSFPSDPPEPTRWIDPDDFLFDPYIFF